MRAAGEEPKIARTLWRRRMMQKFGWITFHDSIDIVHAKLALIDKEPVRWRIVFEDRDCSFDSPNSADERADQQCDDAEMRDEEGKMMFAPRPARQRGTGKVRPEQNQPDIEPRRAIDVSARHFCVETRFVNRSRNRRDDHHREQNHRELQRRKKFENRVALPRRLLSGIGVCHLWIDTFGEVNACFKVERVVLKALANKCASGAEFLVSAATSPVNNTLRLRRFISHRLRRSRSTTLP